MSLITRGYGVGSSIISLGLGSGTVRIPRRALILLNGILTVLPTNLIGTGQKPIVLDNGILKAVSSVTGKTPVIFVDGIKRTLASTEDLVI